MLPWRLVQHPAHAEEPTSDPGLRDKDGRITEIRLHNVAQLGHHGAQMEDGRGTRVKSFNIFKNESGWTNELYNVKDFGEKISVILLLLLLTSHRVGLTWYACHND